MTITPAAGSNLNVALSTTGDLAVNTNQLYVDTSKGNVGIGTTGPDQTLLVKATTPTFSIQSTGTVNAVSLGMFQDQAGTRTYGGYMALDASTSNWRFVTRTNNTDNTRLTILNTGNVGIGTTAPVTLGHIVSTTTAPDAQRNILTLGANVTGAGIGSAGLGVGVLLQAESSTTVDTTQAAIATSWIVATHATRTARLALSAYDTAAREGLRIDADGAAARIGFLGATAAARRAHVADPTGGATTDAEARTAINAILVTLETFGLHSVA